MSQTETDGVFSFDLKTDINKQKHGYEEDSRKEKHGIRMTKLLMEEKNSFSFPNKAVSLSAFTSLLFVYGSSVFCLI